jgi:5-methylcytosine-specific restriction protein A
VIYLFYNDALDISSETWMKLLLDRNITLANDLEVIKLVYGSENHELRASEIAEYMSLTHHGPINLQVSRFSKRVIQKTGVQPPLRKNGTPRWWHVPFLGYEEGNRFPWIMRPQLVIGYEKAFGESDEALLYQEELERESAELTEGAMVRISVNRYERNRKAKNKCIEHYGSSCCICGFDFGKRYGPIGDGRIHVHHLVPLTNIQKEYVIDPIKDLRPVCPNCHLIIHSKKEPFTIEELKEMLRGSATTHNNGFQPEGRG